MIDDILGQLKADIAKSHDGLRTTLSKIRTGRANPDILDGVRIDYWGTITPLSQVATVSVPEARMLMVKVWDRQNIKAVEKGIMEADLGLNPMNDGEIIRVPIPALTEERRKDIAKQVKAKGEEHKVAIRNERREANEKLKELLKAKSITEDESKRANEKVQKETDAGVKTVEDLVVKKEKEVLEV